MYAAVRTNQTGYITVTVWVARDLWQSKHLSSGFALRLSLFIAIHVNPWSHAITKYYIHVQYIIIIGIIIGF